MQVYNNLSMEVKQYHMVNELKRNKLNEHLNLVANSNLSIDFYVKKKNTIFGKKSNIISYNNVRLKPGKFFYCVEQKIITIKSTFLQEFEKFLRKCCMLFNCLENSLCHLLFAVYT
jgi:hypothetical protein